MIILLRILHVDSVFTECLPKDYMLHAQRTIKTCWAPKNWCLWTAVLDKTLESPLDGKETKPVNPKGNQSWIFIGRTDAEAKAPILWPPDVKTLMLARKDWGQEKGTTEDRKVGWHHWLNGQEFEPTLGNSEGQGSLVCCSPRGCKELDVTEWLKNNNQKSQMAFLFFAEINKFLKIQDNQNSLEKEE